MMELKWSKSDAIMFWIGIAVFILMVAFVITAPSIDHAMLAFVWACICVGTYASNNAMAFVELAKETVEEQQALIRKQHETILKATALITKLRAEAKTYH